MEPEGLDPPWCLSSGLSVGGRVVRVINEEERWAIVLREFVRTLTTDFPIQGIVDHLVGRVVEVLPVTGAGVTLISHDLSPKCVSASSDDALGFEQLQSKYGDGPCGPVELGN